MSIKMNETKTIFIEPLFQITENFLNSDECKKLIAAAEFNLSASNIINGVTGLSEISDYRTSENYDLPYDHELSHVIYDRVSHAIGIDSARFENIEIIKYQVEEKFDAHVDYFMPNTEKRHYEKGGQRVGTVILYLNDVESGGETFFPRLRIVEQANTGKMLYFKYDYDADINMKTTHKGMPVEKGEKWIATIWIKQFPRTQIIDNYNVEDLTPANDTEYELECLTSSDTRMLSVKLPANYNSENVIIVDITTKLSSMLLLYLLSTLNTHQNIPYFILPVITDNYNSDQIDLISKMIYSFNNVMSDEYILNIELYTGQNSKIKNLIELINNKSENRFYKFSHLFMSDTKNLVNLTEESEFSTDTTLLVYPFLNLEESHLLYAIKELKIDLINQ